MSLLEGDIFAAGDVTPVQEATSATQRKIESFKSLMVGNAAMAEALAVFTVGDMLQSDQTVQHELFRVALQYPELEMPEEPKDEAKIDVVRQSGLLVTRHLVVLSRIPQMRSPEGMLHVSYWARDPRKEEQQEQLLSEAAEAYTAYSVRRPDGLVPGLRPY